MAIREGNTASLPDRIQCLEDALKKNDNSGELSRAIHGALGASLAESVRGNSPEQSDRLPLGRAKRETEALGARPPLEWVSHVLGSWVLGQHLYWSVGRGLGDARGNGKRILRLKVVPEEGGWTLAPGATVNVSNRPRPTPDRLGTALSLMAEAGMFVGKAQ